MKKFTESEKKEIAIKAAVAVGVTVATVGLVLLAKSSFKKIPLTSELIVDGGIKLRDGGQLFFGEATKVVKGDVLVLGIYRPTETLI